MNLSTLALSVILILCLPGPTNTLLATSGMGRGVKASLPLIFVELIGYLIAMAFWGKGITFFSHRFSWLHLALNIVCAIYLMRLACIIWLNAHNQLIQQKTVNIGRLFTATIMNPKAFIFASSIFPSIAFNNIVIYLELMGLFSILLLPIGVFWIVLGKILVNNQVSWLKPAYTYRAASVIIGLFSLWLGFSWIKF